MQRKFRAKNRVQRTRFETAGGETRTRIDTAERRAYIDGAESSERRSATFEEETGPCGARPTTGMIEVADRRFRPARLLLPGGAGSHTWDTLGLRPGVQTIASEEMSSPTVTPRAMTRPGTTRRLGQ